MKESVPKQDKESQPEESEKKSGKRDKAAPVKVPSDYNVFIKLFGQEVLDKIASYENTERFKLISEAFKKVSED